MMTTMKRMLVLLQVLLVALLVLLSVQVAMQESVVHAHVVLKPATSATTTTTTMSAARAAAQEARLAEVRARARAAHAKAMATTALGAGDGTPIQQRIALVPYGMTVSWSTSAPLATDPTVAFGLAPNQLTMSTSGYSEWYSPSSTYFHHVVLNILLPRKTYYWQVTSTTTVAEAAASGATPNVTTPVWSFTAGLLSGDTTSFKVSVNGDLGLGNSDDSVALLKKQAATTDLFWHIGDLAYADDAILLGMTYEEVQETWMSEMTDVWQSRPYMILPGNHEATCNEVLPIFCPDGQSNFTSFRERFRMPYEESGAPTNMYYSFDYGLVHFISIDTEVDLAGAPEGPGTSMSSGPFGDQFAWLKADLAKAAANRANVPWIFVGGHRPYYTSADTGALAGSREQFEPLFLQYNVDMVFWGHVHWYERMWPTGANGTVQQQSYVNPKAPVYMIVASAGNIEGLHSGEVAQPYTAFVDSTHYGVSTLTVHNATHVSLVFEESATGQVLDAFTLVQTRN